MDIILKGKKAFEEIILIISSSKKMNNSLVKNIEIRSL